MLLVPFLMQPMLVYGKMDVFTARAAEQVQREQWAADRLVRDFFADAKPLSDDPVRVAALDDDDGFSSLLIGAVQPRNCVLTASPNPARLSLDTQITLSVTGCTRNPTSYEWSGPGIATGTSTTGTSVVVATPAATGSYAYTVVAKRANIRGVPASTRLTVQLPPLPNFAAFEGGPLAVRVGQSPQSVLLSLT